MEYAVTPSNSLRARADLCQDISCSGVELPAEAVSRSILRQAYATSLCACLDSVADRSTGVKL